MLPLSMRKAHLNVSQEFEDGEAIPHGWIFACFMASTMIGSQIFSELVKANMSVSKCLASVFVVSSCALLVPAFVSSYFARMLSFFVFEICCGLFWPSIGTLRGRVVPDSVRTTIMNLFRVPLNFFVVVTLLYVRRTVLLSTHHNRMRDDDYY